MSAVVEDLSDVIAECSVSLTAVRFIPAPIVNGRLEAKPEEIREEFEGSFQPMTGKEMQRLPEGKRNQERAKIYTPYALHAVDTSAARVADRVIYKGAIYQVDKVQDWSDLGGYYRVEVVRMGQ